MIPVKPQQQNSSNNPFKINDQIRAKEIRLIDQDGNMIGVTTVAEGIRMAQEADLDLIEVSPKVVEVKEVKMTINIGKADFDTKIRHTIEFVEKGNKVKISIRMKGREITHRDLAEKMMVDILKDTEEFAKPEINPRLEGMQMVVTLIKK